MENAAENNRVVREARSKDKCGEDEMQSPKPRLELIPARHTKVLHFIRHAEGYHNVAGTQDLKNYLSEKYADAQLTKKGWQQVAGLQSHIKSLPDHFQVDLVVLSPLTRALETGIGVFGGDSVEDPDGHKVLMRGQTELEGVRVAHKAIVSGRSPPFIAHEACREQSGQHPCDRRHPTSYLMEQFPGVDFSLLESENDTLWEPTERESREALRTRIWVFLKWLYVRPERHIAVVSHAGFLRNMSRCFGEGMDSAVQEELHKEFQNCEMRTVQMIDYSGSGINGQSCQYSQRGGDSLLHV